VQAYTVNLTGTPASGETWSIVVNGVTNSVPVNASVDTLAEIAEAMAAAIRGHASLSGYTASAKGASLLILKNTTGAFGTAPQLSVSVAVAGFAGPADAAVASLIDLSGTPVTNDTWRVTTTVGATTVHYTVVVGELFDLGNGAVVVDTLGEIAQALAKKISAGANGFAATTEGTRIVVAGPAGATISASFSAAATSTPSWGPAITTASASFATLTGTPAAGDLYRVVLNGVTLTHTVVAGQGRETVAAALAALINDSAFPALADFSAIGDASQLVIVKRSAGSFTPTYSIVGSPAGRAMTAGGATTVNANTLALTGTAAIGQVWSVRLELAGTPNPTIVTASYAVATAGATLADIAAGLAAAINAQAQANFTALAEGSQLFIVDRAGTSPAFLATYAAAQAGAMAVSTVAAAESAIVSATVSAGSYSVSLAGGAASVSYSPLATDTAANIAAALAALINNSTDPDAAQFSAAANGARLFIVDRLAPAAAAAGYSYTRAPVSVNGETATASVSLSVTASNVFAGEAWVLTLTSGGVATTYSVPATALTNLQDLLDALAALVNADAATLYTADTGSGSLQLFRSGNDAFQASLSVATAGVPTVDAVTARTAMVVLTGNPIQGEQWHLALAGQTYTVTAGASPTLAGIASSLAALVNADNVNAAAYSAIGEAGTLVIVHRDGAAVVAAISVTPATAQTVAAGAPVASVGLFGYPLAGEVWTVTVAGRAYAVTVDNVTDTLPEIAAAIADAIRIDNTFEGLVARLARAITAGGIYTATANGLDLTITRTGGSFTASVSNASGSYTDSEAVAGASVTLTLGGSLTHGETWSVTISEAGVPTVITAIAFDRFTAVSEGSAVLVVDLTATAFTPALTVKPVSGYAVNGAAPAAFIGVLNSNLTTGNTWTITLTGPAGVSQSFSVVVGNTYVFGSLTIDAITEAGIAQIFAQLINAGGSAALTAMSEGNQLAIVSRDAWTAVLAGTPAAGEVWRVTLNGVNYDHVAGAGATPASIAAALAASINAAGTSFVASADGRMLFILDGSGAAAVPAFRIDNVTAPRFARATTGLPALASAWKAAFAVTPVPAATPASVVADTQGATTVTFSGRQQPREIWSLTVDGNRFDVSIGDTYTFGAESIVADSASALAKIFALYVNALPGGLYAITQGNALVIVNRAGAGFADFVTTFRFIPALDNTADGLYDTDPAGGAVSIELVGSPVLGEKWTVSLAGGVLSYSYYALRDDSLAVVARALADAINGAAAAADYVATAEGDRLVIVKTTAGAIVASVDATPADDRTGPADSGNVQLLRDSVNPGAWSAILAGAPVKDDVWRVTLDGVHYDYTVVDGDSTTDIAAELAALINAGSGDYAAMAEGRTLIVIDGTSPFVAPIFRIDAAGGTVSFAADPRFTASGVDLTLASAAVTLTGSFAPGQIYTLLLRVGEVGWQSSYVTVAGDGASQVAKALAAAANVNGPEDYTAVADGARLYIVNRTGISFSLENDDNIANAPVAGTAAVVNLTAATLFAGEVWTVFLDDGTFATTHVHVVGQGETLADLARELANSIVSSGVVTFTATTDGTRLIIANLAGQQFTTQLEVTPAGQVSIVETRKFNTPVAGNNYFYRPVNLNTRVDEATQVDTMTVYNSGSPADDEGELTADHLTGLGMGGDTVIAGRTLPGGIVYRDLEVLDIRLGSGNDKFTVLSTHTGTTRISSGTGIDHIVVQSIDGHTSIDAGAGDDHIWIGSDAAQNLPTPNLLGTLRVLLTVVGGAGNDTMYVDDSADTDDSTGILTGSTLTGLGMPSVSEVQTIHVQAATGVYTLRIADETIDSTTATTTLVEISGTPIATDKWRIVIDGDTDHDYEVTVDGTYNTLGAIAARLAFLINADTPRGFTAVADGAVIVIVKPTGEGFQAVFEIQTSATAPTATVQEIEGATTTAVLTGTLRTGDSWVFTVSGQVLPGIAVGALTTMADIATSLATAINGLAGYLAIAVGDSVVIMDRAAPVARPTISLSISLASAAGTGSSIGVNGALNSVALSLAGTPVGGEVWTIALNGTTSVAVTYGESVNGVTVDTLPEFAAALAFKTNALATFSATAVGNTLIVVDRSGAALPSDLAVEVGQPGPATLPASAAAGASMSVALQGGVIFGEKWVLELTSGTALTSVNYTAKAGDTLDDVAAGLKLALEASTDPVADHFAVTRTGATLQLVNAAAASAAVTVLPAAAITSTREDAATTSFELAGTPTNGDRWIVTINGTQYSVERGTSTVLANGVPLALAAPALTLAQIAGALAQAINATAPAGFTTFVDGTTLIVTERNGVAFSAAAVVALAQIPGGTVTAPTPGQAIVVALSGDPVANEIWRLIVGVTSYQIVVGDSYTAGGQTFIVDTREEIALVLADKVNTPLGNIVATQVGDTVVLISRNAALFTAGL
jgi:hypothetical protein